MKRVMVIGCCGSGKSTLSKKLHKITGLELFHLDQHYWKPNWTETSSEEWEKVVRNLIAKDQWIMDGNYGGTMDIRIERADTIIFLNYSTVTCFFRVLRRTIQFLGKTRPDMPQACPERFEFQFFHYVLNYKRTRAKGILQKLMKVENEKQVFIFRNDRHANNFFSNLKTNPV